MAPPFCGRKHSTAGPHATDEPRNASKPHRRPASARPPAVRQRPRLVRDLRNSFASLLLHEGRFVIYVARQRGHDARYTLGTYGHVIDELDGQPQLGAEDAIAAARDSVAAARRLAVAR